MSHKQVLAAFFEQNQGVPISRNTVIQLAPQLDSLKRLRRNGGARDILDGKGIVLLWGGGTDRLLIAQLGLGIVGSDEFIAYRPKSAAEAQLIQNAGHRISYP